MDLIGTKTITLGGVEYTVSPLTLDDAAELQEWVNSKLEDPTKVAKEIAAGQPPEVAKEILLAAYEDVRQGARKLGSMEATRLLTSFDGMVQMVFLTARKHHPEKTRDDWAKIVMDTIETDIRSLETAMAEKELGGLPDPKGPSSSDLTDALPTGDGFSCGSLNDTDGLPPKSDD